MKWLHGSATCAEVSGLLWIQQALISHPENQVIPSQSLMCACVCITGVSSIFREILLYVYVNCVMYVEGELRSWIY